MVMSAVIRHHSESLLSHLVSRDVEPDVVDLASDAIGSEGLRLRLGVQLPSLVGLPAGR